MENVTSQKVANNTSIVQLLLKFVASMAILAVTAFLTPGFQISSLLTLTLAAVVLTILDYLLAIITGIHASPYGRGIIGFISAAVIIYVTQFFVAGYSITILSSIIAALIYGVIDAFIPDDIGNK